jgi:hypothetical protein
MISGGIEGLTQGGVEGVMEGGWGEGKKEEWRKLEGTIEGMT